MSETKVKNSQLASDVPRPNLLQNGGLEQWHYGVGPINTPGLPGPDKWALSINGTDTLSVSRDGVNVDSFSQYCAACTYVAGTGANSVIAQGFGATFGAPSVAGKTFTVSVRCRTATANAARIVVYGDGGFVTSYSAFQTGSGAYQTLSLTFTCTGTQTYFYVGLQHVLSCTAYWDNAMLVPGVQVSDFVPSLSYPDALPAERLGTDVFRYNYLVNGGMAVAQRGNGPFTVYGVYTADRWQMLVNGTSTMSVTVGVVGVIPPDPGGSAGNSNCLYGTFTYVVGGANVYQTIKTGAAEPEHQALKGRRVTFSMRFYCLSANAVSLYIQTDGTGSGQTFSAQHAGAGWQTLSVSALVPGDATYIQLNLYFAAAVAGTWYAGAAVLSLGAVAPDFQPLPPANDLVSCQRYYEVMGAPGAGDLIIGGSGATIINELKRTDFIWRAQKPVSPTMTRVGTWSLANVSAQPVAASASTHGFYTQVVATAAGGADTYAYNNNSGNCFTAEANP